MKPGPGYADKVFLLGLCLIAAGLPFSKFLMSLGQITMAAGWLLTGSYRNFRLFLKNYTALLLSAVFFLHLTGLIYTSDFSYGLEDIKKKLPLLLIPFLLVTGPTLTEKRVGLVLQVFLWSVTAASLLVIYNIYSGSVGGIYEARKASPFISHIRLSLMMAFAVFISFSMFFKTGSNRKLVFLIPPVLILLSLTLMQAMTGLSAIIAAGMVSGLLYFVRTSRRLPATLLLMVFMATTVFFIIYAWNEYRNINIATEQPMLKRSASGEEYQHNTALDQRENGNLIYINIAWNELSRAWNTRSGNNFDGLDSRGNSQKVTLLRYLASHGLTKDSTGVWSLHENEIRAIENGVPNYRYLNISPIELRLKKLVWEVDNYLRDRDPNGHSLTMRFEYWKTAAAIIRDNPLLGVGTGDVKMAFESKYEELQSRLQPRWRLRTHNQYLTVAVALGIPGMIFFLASLLLPVFYSPKHSVLLYMAFITIAMMSMLSDDTLETQAGVTFYAFFNSLLLFGATQRLARKKSQD